MGGNNSQGRYQHQSWIREYTINSGDSSGNWTDSKEIVSNWSTNFIKKYWTDLNDDNKEMVWKYFLVLLQISEHVKENKEK